MASLSPYQEKLDQWANTIANDLYEKQKNQEKMERPYKVMKLNELASSLKLPSSKGQKTSDYLEFVISEIEKRGYRFVQFLQLVDVLYVIIDVAGHIQNVNLPEEKFRPEEEIRDHYNPPAAKATRKKEEILVPQNEKFEEALDAVKSRDHLNKNMSGAKLPWKK